MKNVWEEFDNQIRNKAITELLVKYNKEFDKLYKKNIESRILSKKQAEDLLQKGYLYCIDNNHCFFNISGRIFLYIKKEE